MIKPDLKTNAMCVLKHIILTIYMWHPCMLSLISVITKITTINGLLIWLFLCNSLINLTLEEWSFIDARSGTLIRFPAIHKGGRSGWGGIRKYCACMHIAQVFSCTKYPIQEGFFCTYDSCPGCRQPILLHCAVARNIWSCSGKQAFVVRMLQRKFLLYLLFNITIVLHRL